MIRNVNNVHLVKDEFGEDYYNNYDINPKFGDRNNIFDKLDILNLDRTATEWLELVILAIGICFGLVLLILVLMTTKTCHVFCVTTWVNPKKNWTIIKGLLCCQDVVYKLVKKSLIKEGLKLSYKKYIMLLRRFAISHKGLKSSEVDRVLQKKLKTLRPKGDELATVEALEEEEKKLVEAKRVKHRLEDIYVIAVQEAKRGTNDDQEQEVVAKDNRDKYKQVGRKLIVVGGPESPPVTHKHMSVDESGDQSGDQSDEESPLLVQPQHDDRFRDDHQERRYHESGFVESFYGKRTPRWSIGSPPFHHLPYPNFARDSNDRFI